MRLVLTIRGRLVLLAMLILMAAAFPLRTTIGQQSAPSNTVEDLQALAASIEDEAKRNELLATIRALIAAKESRGAGTTPAPLSERIGSYSAGAIRAAEEAADDIFIYFEDWQLVVDWLKREISDPVARAKGLNNAAAFVAIFAVGWFAEYLLWRILAGTRRQIDQASKRSGPARIVPVITRVGVDLLPIVAFALVAYGTALLVQPAALVRAVGLNFVNAYLIARVLMAGVRLLLSPAAPTLRVLPLPDAIARDLFVWVGRFVGIGVGGCFVIAAAVLLGLPRPGAAALVTILGAILVMIGIGFVLRPDAGWPAGCAGRATRPRLASARRSCFRRSPRSDTCWRSVT